MQSVLIVIHLMIVVVLVAVVLLQRSEGGVLGVGSTSGFLTGRSQANALTRATAILAALFFITSLALTFLARIGQGPEITFQSVTPVEPKKTGAAKEGGGKASLLDQLRQMEDQSSRPPGLPPGVNIPGQPAPPQGQSVLETRPAGQEGLNLPAQKSPPNPLTTLAPGLSGPAALPEPAPEPKPLPFKPQTRGSAPPWEK
ncbi:MAG: preprotein translocase subunit SecG [Methylocapsa sp.]|nr:preprotein translocase subunit SecG [Methylocapsa sp.]